MKLLSLILIATTGVLASDSDPHSPETPAYVKTFRINSTEGLRHVSVTTLKETSSSDADDERTPSHVYKEFDAGLYGASGLVPKRLVVNENQKEFSKKVADDILAHALASRRARLESDDIMTDTFHEYDRTKDKTSPPQKGLDECPCTPTPQRKKVPMECPNPFQLPLSAYAMDYTPHRTVQRLKEAQADTDQKVVSPSEKYGW